MSESWRVFNNEGICAIGLMCVLERLGSLSLAKSLLVMPIIMHRPTIKFLKNGNVRPREAAALTAIRPDLILNFSERFYNGLPISLNAVQIVIAGGFASLDSEIRFEKALQVDKSFGNRANDIVKAANNLAALLSSPVEELYLNLRVKL